MTRLAHDDEFPHAVHRRLRDASGAERVPAERINIHSGPRSSPLQELSNRVSVQAASRDMTVSLNGPEDRAFLNPGPIEPLAQRQDWTCLGARSEGQAHLASGALLVRFRLADGNDDAVRGELKVTYMDGGEFRAPEAACESY